MLTKTLETPVYYNPDLTQIINGEEIMSPSPFLNHHEITVQLFRILDRFAVTNNLGIIGFAPVDVILEEGFNRLQPDLFYISNANSGIKQDWIRGVPDMVVEIVSPGSMTIDKVVKKGIYERYGVQECWLIFPKKKTIEIYSLIETKYELSESFGPGDQVSCPILPGLSFPLDDIFE